MNHIANTKNIRNRQLKLNALKLGFPQFDATVSKIERKRDEIGSGCWLGKSQISSHPKDIWKFYRLRPP
jgi:hypothetical protein